MKEEIEILSGPCMAIPADRQLAVWASRLGHGELLLYISTDCGLCLVHKVRISVN